MVTKFDPLIQEIKRSCLTLSPNLTVVPRQYGEETLYHLEVPATSRFFRIGYHEYVFVSLFNGQRSFAQALAITAQKLGPNSLDEPKAIQIVQWLLENGLAFFEGSNAVGTSEKLKEQKVTLLQKLNPFWLKIPLGSPHETIAKLNPFVGWMFSSWGIALGCLVILTGLFNACFNWEQIAVSSTTIFSASNWIYLLLTWVVLKFVHEFAHGLACYRYGGKIKDTGVIFILLAPMAYVDVSSSWRFESRWQRIWVACAGMFVELVIAALATWALCYSQSEWAKHLWFNVILMASLATLVFNANPLMKFDGYFVLSDLLRIPNLFENGNRSFHAWVKRICFGERSPQSCVEIRNHGKLVLAYGGLASIWKVIVCVGLGLTAASMFGGLGVFIALLGVASWFGKPSQKIFEDLLRRYRTKPISLFRMSAVAATCLSLLLMTWFVIPCPFQESCQFVIRYQGQTEVRADTSGVIRELLVEDGQWVEQGQPLIQLANFELESEVLELQAKLGKRVAMENVARIKATPAKAQVERKNQEALCKILSIKQKQLDCLTILAPKSGRVISRNLSQRLGSYVRVGDLMATIADESKKEAMLLVDSEKLNASSLHEGDQLALAIGSRKGVFAEVKLVEPKASVDVQHKALIALNGGTLLAKELDGDGERRLKSAEASQKEHQLLTPHVKVLATLSSEDSVRLFAGERGFAKVHGDADTLGRWVWTTATEWLEKQVRLAQGQTS